VEKVRRWRPADFEDHRVLRRRPGDGTGIGRVVIVARHAGALRHGDHEDEEAQLL
jgi:hypothetical protein